MVIGKRMSKLFAGNNDENVYNNNDADTDDDKDDDNDDPWK